MDKLSLPTLRDIHLPAEPSMWPLAIGWWILIVLVIVFIYWLFVTIRKHRKFKRYQTEVQQKFERLEESFKEKPSNQAIAKIGTLLRQIAVNTYPRQDTASLTGNDWLAFLDKSGKTSNFTKGEGKVLIEAPYQSESSLESLNQDEFLSLIKGWVKKQISFKKKSKNSTKNRIKREVNK